uniref:Uncharacterized protein n=1 Tax=Arundo donax TaxID=35708 RepID=A0A0A9CUE2_ARUDO
MMKVCRHLPFSFKRTSQAATFKWQKCSSSLTGHQVTFGRRGICSSDEGGCRAIKFDGNQ